MRMITGRWLPGLGIGCLVVVGTVGSGVALGDEEEAPSTDKRAAIERLMEVTKASDMQAQMGTLIAQQVVQMSGAQTTEAVARSREIAATVVGETLAEANLLDEVIPIYEKYFTHEEILQMIAFYETPIGKKAIEVMPQLMVDSMQAGQRWAMTVMPEVEQKVLAQMREEGLFESEEGPVESEEG